MPITKTISQVSSHLMQDVNSKSTRIPEMDGLRGFAILLVLGWHFVFPFVSTPSSLLERAIFPFAALSWSGVDLFFVISGFLLGGQLLENQKSQNYYETFYARRALRILPLYLIWLAISELCINTLSPEHRPWLLFAFHDPFPLWVSLSFVQNIFLAYQNSFQAGGHWLSATWSLAMEEQFYFFLPIFLRFNATQKLPKIILGIVLASPFLRLFPNSSLTSFLLIPFRLDSFLLGVLAAWLIRQEAWKDWVEKFKNLPALLLIIFSGTILALTAFGHQIFLSPIIDTLGITWVAISYFLLLLCLAGTKKFWLHRIFRCPPLRWVGMISYGVFLMHTGVGAIFGGVWLNSFLPVRSWHGALVTLLSVISTLILAFLAHIWIEKPARKFAPKY